MPTNYKIPFSVIFIKYDLNFLCLYVVTVHNYFVKVISGYLNWISLVDIYVAYVSS
jgi:hypothetical protein